MDRREARAAIVLSVAFWLVLLALVAAVVSAQNLPLATDVDRAFAQLAISRDGREITLRANANDDLAVCIEPRVGAFGARRCYAARDLRAGLVRR